jgi:hypothetical protein
MATTQKAATPGRRAVAPEQAWGPELTRLMKEWCARTRIAQHAYYAKSERLRVWNFMLGIPVVIVTAVVGTSVFASINSHGVVSPHTKIFVGAISVLAAVLASIQTFTKLGEAAQQHGVAGDWYAAIRRDIEQEMNLPPSLRERPQVFMSRIRKEMNAAAEKAPELGERWWQAFAGGSELKDLPNVRAKRPWFIRTPLGPSPRAAAHGVPRQ